MPTCSIQIEDNRLILVAAVSLPAPDNSDPASFRALVDTGAQRSMVAANVVEAVGAPIVSIGSYMAVNGAVESTEVYRLRMDIPVSEVAVGPDGGVATGAYLGGMDLDALLMAHQPPDFDIVWGMDFLSAFHITMVSGLFVLSV